MTLRYFAFAATALLSAGAAQADTFQNGSFEGGTFAGWTQGGGTWFGGAYPTPAQYLPGGSAYNASYITNTITNVGFDPLTDNKVRTAYAGLHSARINDPGENYSVSVISQKVNNYTDAQISFAYAAVLEGSHGPTDSDAFIITLKDLTTNNIVYSFNLNSATAAGVFTLSNAGWYYRDWTSINIDTSVASGLNGHSFELSLLANDCPYGGHAGYAYLDGFGSVTGGNGDPVGGVPEPATWAMMIAGFGLVGGAMRRRSTEVAFAA